MRCHTFISSFVALSLTLPAYSFSPIADDPPTLLPINLRDFEAAVGIQRRDSDFFSDLDPANQAQLLYGQPGENGGLLLANMTLHASDGVDIVLMEKFNGLTTNVDCKGDDGFLSMTFKSKEAFDQAFKKWSFVNKPEKKKFLLITNHQGCGPDDERQAYLITDIVENSSALTTTLTATKAPWSKIAKDFELVFGKVPVTPVSQRRVKNRGIIPNFIPDLSKSVAFPINVGEAGVTKNIVDRGNVKFDCINCFIAGKLKVTGRVKVRLFSIKEAVIEASPQDVKAELQLRASISALKQPISFDQSTELASIPIPGAGIEVPGIFKLGATIAYSVGVNVTLNGQGVVDFGLAANLPNSAKVTANLKNLGGSSVDGFGGTTFVPLFNVKSLTANVQLDALSTATIAFGIEVIKLGKLDMEVSLQVPKVTTALTAAYDQNGVCATTPGSLKTGVKLASQAAFEVDVDFNAKLGSSGNPTKRFPIPIAGTNLFSQCFPIDIPGLKPVAHTSLLPADSDAIATGVPFVLSAGVVGSESPTLQPSGAPVPSGLMPRGSFRGPYRPIRV